MSNRPHLLVVDDEEITRLSYAGLLSAENYRVDSVADGETALEQVRRNPPDAILLDLMMPGLDGLEVCRRIKGDPTLGFIPIVLITALTDPRQQFTAIEAGADDFLTKPVSGLELRTRVRSMLRIKKQYEDVHRLMKLREDLVHMIIHDMRSPMQMIEGLSEIMLRYGSLPEQTTQDVASIQAHAARLRSFVDEILMIAKMEDDRIAVNRMPTDLHELLERSTRNWSTLLATHQQTLRLESPAGLVRQVDQDLIQRIIDNLISNAVKFSPKNATITVRWIGNTQARDPSFQLEVEDEGPGIPPEERDRIFQKFAVLEVRKRGLRQIGLGLTFCKMAAEAHGGHIAVDQGRRGGSLFRVRFPG